MTSDYKLSEMGFDIYEHEWGLMLIRHIDGTQYNVQVDIDEDEVKTQIVTNEDMKEFLRDNPHYTKLNQHFGNSGKIEK